MRPLGTSGLLGALLGGFLVLPWPMSCTTLKGDEAPSDPGTLAERADSHSGDAEGDAGSASASTHGSAGDPAGDGGTLTTSTGTGAGERDAGADSAGVVTQGDAGGRTADPGAVDSDDRNADPAGMQNGSAGSPGSDAGGEQSPAAYTIHVTVSGIGAGTVTSSAGGSCGPLNDTCDFSVAAGQQVILTAAAEGEDSAFVGWGQGCSDDGATCTLQVGEDLDVSAEFTRMFDVSVRFQRSDDCGTQDAADVYVTTNVPGLSAENCSACSGAICHARFPAGTQLAITANPGVPSPNASSCQPLPGVATLANPAIAGSCTANTQGGGFSTSAATCYLTLESNASVVVYSCQQSG